MKRRALTVYEDTNMYGGPHVTNFNTALKACREERDLIVHSKHYDGQRYHYRIFRVTNLHKTSNGHIIGTTEDGGFWKASANLCNYAKIGRI